MKPRRSGRILNIGSISVRGPHEGNASPVTASFGGGGLRQVIALDGRPHGINYSCLHPGNIRVERRIESGVEPESIACAALAMMTLAADVTFLEAIVLPTEQAYLGRD